MEKLSNIDDLDLKIITILLKNAKVPYKEIAKELKVSLGTIHVRIKKLESLKVIKGFTLEADFFKLGYTITAFIGLIIDGKIHEQVVAQLLEIEELVELHHTTGNYHMFAKIVCEDPKVLKEILLNKISNISGVEKTETTISL
ncbi:MAG: transcriptional regulator AsnC [Marinilabiliales bacterium]|nr:MAG: transcriptional regulator AsnC [Marinilabiliales bacterium]